MKTRINNYRKGKEKEIKTNEKKNVRKERRDISIP